MIKLREKKWVGISGLVVVIIIGAYHILGQAPEPPPTPEIKIGVVNIAEVFNKYKRREQFTADLEKEKAQEEVKIKDIENHIKELRKQIEVLDPDSELRMEKEFEVRKRTMELEERIKLWNRRINNKVNEQTARLYNEIRETIVKYAREKNFTFILKVDPFPLEKDSEENTSLRINIRSVLYYEAALDLTQEIINILNK